MLLPDFVGVNAVLMLGSNEISEIWDILEADIVLEWLLFEYIYLKDVLFYRNIFLWATLFPFLLSSLLWSLPLNDQS